MTGIADSVRLALNLYSGGEDEAALLFASLAVDGTAAKVAGRSAGNRARFTGLIRDNFDIFGPFGVPGIALETRFPVAHNGKSEIWDVADLVYKVHRCSHGHGDELPQGFELIPDSRSADRISRMQWDGITGTVRLSDRVIFGLLAVAVSHPINADVTTGEIGYLTYGGRVRFEVAHVWGRRSLFKAVVADDPAPSVLLDFSNHVGTIDESEDVDG